MVLVSVLDRLLIKVKEDFVLGYGRIQPDQEVESYVFFVPEALWRVVLAPLKVPG